MSFEAFSEEDVEKIVEHTIKQAKPEDVSVFVEKYGSMEAFREALAKDLKDPETEAHLIKLYGGKDKAVDASLSATGDKEDIARFAKETDEIYRQFAEAMKTGNADLKEDALRRLAESNKAVWHFENVRYYLLQLADTFERIPELIEATDKEYGRKAFWELREAAKQNGIQDMSLEEINAEIQAVRSEVDR